MGVALKSQGNADKAIDSYKKAIEINPNNSEAYCNMGNALQDQGKSEKAVEAYQKALSIEPNSTDAYNNLGNVFQKQDKLEASIKAYQKALKLNPSNVQAWSNGAEILEKWNLVERLDLWLREASDLLENIPADIKFMQAKLFWRSRNFKEASSLIATIDFEAFNEVQKQDYFNLKAKCHDALHNFNKAYKCFKKMNSLTKKSKSFLAQNPNNFFDKATDQLKVLKSRLGPMPTNHSIEKTNFTPIFLVGFPRSGTTLLDTILRTHSDIDVVEEQSSLEVAKMFIHKSGYNDVIHKALPPKVLLGAKNAYHSELAKFIKRENLNSVYIDKLPLNLLNTPLIYQLYPNAKFILALRHPMDTILSCWMQNFGLNPAMANMVDLDRIVDLYSVAMETFEVCRTNCNLNVHSIRYEDLLDNLRGETTSVLKFLDLEWQPQMENYQKTALERGAIDTPSYSQVVQPIYKNSMYRWLNYEKYLIKYLARVEPWIHKFGYCKH